MEDNFKDFSKILDRLKVEDDGKRQRVSLYLSESLYKDFRVACGNVPASRVIEELMRAAIEEKESA